MTKPQEYLEKYNQISKICEHGLFANKREKVNVEMDILWYSMTPQEQEEVLFQLEATNKS